MGNFVRWEKVLKALGKRCSPTNKEYVPNNSNDPIVSIGTSVHHQHIQSVVLTYINLGLVRAVQLTLVTLGKV